MNTYQQLVSKKFARDLHDAIDDYRFDEESQTYGNSPLGVNTRPSGIYRDVDGNEVVGINITLEKTVIGNVELNLKDALELASNITDAVRNRI
tara:strand:+ start:74 stop:352 length:279 start_codon:yes stop_codon:yes gene_type:complete